MASREGDTALWLHNKLGSTNDLWSGASICSQLNRDKLLSIQDCFHNLQPYVKLKLLLAFLHLPKRNIDEWRSELEEIMNMAQDDTDQWVAVAGNILKTFPAAGSLNTDIDDHHNFFHEVLNDLKKLVKKASDTDMPPLECLYLGRGALNSVAGPTQTPARHFSLKRKPKSASLRMELLQKSSEAANNLKKTGTSSSIPVKFRSFAKKMDDTSPMRGIPNRTGQSGGFLKASTLARSFGGNSGQRSLAARREGGIKLLDISEQPVGGREAKRRRKQQEQEALEKQRLEKQQQSLTPDYAVNLVSLQHPAKTVTITAANPTPTTQPSYLPITRITPNTVQVSVSSQAAREQLQKQLQQQLATTQVISTPTIVSPTVVPTTAIRVIQKAALPGGVTAVNPVAGAAAANTPTSVIRPTIVTSLLTPTQPRPATIVAAAPVNNTNNPVISPTPPQPQPAAQPPKKGLSLTREQMLTAQEMFRTSNKVTRPEKALILGFMAGSRENPCPQQGDIVNIRLSENSEAIQQPDLTFRPMMVDTYFQMNYGTGEWKRIKKYRELEPEN